MVISERLGETSVETTIVALIQRHFNVYFGTQWAPGKQTIHNYQAVQRWEFHVGAKTSSGVHSSENINTLCELQHSKS
jgi:hypothetical protein